MAMPKILLQIFFFTHDLDWKIKNKNSYNNNNNNNNKTLSVNIPFLPFLSPVYPTFFLFIQRKSARS